MDDFRKGPRAAHAFRDNFWMRKRIDVGLRYSDIAEATGLRANALSRYFSGSTMPNDNAIATICNFFDVDEVRGKSEFIKIHEAWDYHNNKSPLTCKKSRPKATKKASSIEVTAPDDTYKIAEINITLGKAIYGKVDYDTFLKVLDAAYKSDKSTIGEALYGVLDYDTWLTVTNLLNKV